MRLALGTVLVSLVGLASCASRSRTHPTAEDDHDVLRGGCIEPRSSPEIEEDQDDGVRDGLCEMDVSHIDISGYTDDQRLALAKQLFEQGELAYNQGDARLALRKFEAGYAHAHERHVFSVNIGYAAFELGCCKRARAAFQRFLELVPEHPARAIALEKLQLIEQMGCAND